MLQHVTSACHHCLDPACLNACPVDAYEKDPVTGIVKHLDDQCFGCQYCTLACPYDVPKFHAGQGDRPQVRHVRRPAGRARRRPASRPAHTRRSASVSSTRDEVRGPRRGGRIPAGGVRPVVHAADDPLTGRCRPGRPSCRPTITSSEPEHAHAPLVVMLVLTQLSVGGFLVELAARLAGLRGRSPDRPCMLGLSLGLGYVGLAASLLHLGRPLYAYRAILGWRHSWLSREVLAFGLFAKLATRLRRGRGPRAGLGRESPAVASRPAGGGRRVGLCGVGSSVMVYHVVRRPFWRASLERRQVRGDGRRAGAGRRRWRAWASRRRWLRRRRRVPRRCSSRSSPGR